MENLKSCIANVYEYRDSLDEGIKNAKFVFEEQEELLEIIKRSKSKKHKFKEFIDGIENDVLGYKNQVAVLKERLAYANAVLEIYEKGHKQNATAEDRKNADFLEQVVTTMCLAFGIVPGENEQKVRAEQERQMQEQAEKEKVENQKAE